MESMWEVLTMNSLHFTLPISPSEQEAKLSVTQSSLGTQIDSKRALLPEKKKHTIYQSVLENDILCELTKNDNFSIL